MRNFAIFATLLALAAAAPAASGNVPVAIDHVVISEIMMNAPGSNEAGAEWIELYNPGLAAVDVSGWNVTDADPCGAPFNVNGNHVLPEGSVIPASGYLLVVLPAESRICLANGGDDVTLFDALGNIVDQVWYGNGGDIGAEGATFSAPEGQSVARCHLVTADGRPNLDNGSPVDEFYVDATPTPGAENKVCLAAPSLI